MQRIFSVLLIALAACGSNKNGGGDDGDGGNMPADACVGLECQVVNCAAMGQAPTTLTGTVFAPNGWLGEQLARLGVQVAYTWVGVVVALTLIGLPFVVRSVQPALEEVDVSLEEAAESLGASRWTVFRRVVLPTVLPALATGFTLALARAVGEYGSVIFIAGNLPLRTEITPLLIVIKLEQYDYIGAAALGLVMLCVSFVMLLSINAINGWRIRRVAGRR